MSEARILGVAANYSAAVFDRFLGTLRRSGYGGEVTLWVDAARLPSVRSLAEQYGAELLALPPTPYHLQSCRYALYLRLLSERGQPDVVLLTDVRDVVFQADPFGDPALFKTPLTFALEENTIGRSLYNAAWVEHAFGRPTLEKLAGKQISCSGTTFGEREAVQRYLTQMVRITEDLYRSGREIVCGLDQGIHNFMVYAGEWPSGYTAFTDNSCGLVQTLGYAEKFLSGAETIVSSNGQLSRVCHQFDRFNRAMLERFAAASGFPIDDLLVDRAPVKDFSALHLWFRIRGSGGRILAELPENLSLRVELRAVASDTELIHRVGESYLGDTVVGSYPTLVRLLFPASTLTLKVSNRSTGDLALPVSVTVTTQCGARAIGNLTSVHGESGVVELDPELFASGATIELKMTKGDSG